VNHGNKINRVEPDGDLTGKASRLKASSCFTGLTQTYALYEKQMILLASAGYKPVSEANSGHWHNTAVERWSVPDAPEEVAALLTSLGLAYELSVQGHVAVAAVSLQAELIAEYHRTSSEAAIGRLFGYPETAVKAFEAGESLPLGEQRSRMRGAGLPDYFTPFRFSRGFWQDELAVVREWLGVLSAHRLL
jgi:hypothetical protein